MVTDHVEIYKAIAQLYSIVAGIKSPVTKLKVKSFLVVNMHALNQFSIQQYYRIVITIIIIIIFIS